MPESLFEKVVVSVQQLADSQSFHLDRLVTMLELKRQYALAVLRATGGNKVAAARILGVNRRSLYRIIPRDLVKPRARRVAEVQP